MRRVALGLALVLATPLQADQLLPQARITDGGDLSFGALKLGKRASGKTTLQPDSIELQGDGSTGNISSMSVTPTDSATPSPLNDAIGGRLAKGTNDLTPGLYQGLPTLIPFGNTDAKQVYYSYRNDSAPSLLGTTAIVRNTTGSGTFGPVAADFGLFLSTKKDDYKTATGTAAKEGELDSIYAITHQGKKGDAAAILTHGEKRRDNLTTLQPDETGGLLGFEVGSFLVNASGATYHQVHSYGAFMESPGGISGGRGYGFHTAAFKGELFAAYGAESKVGQTGKFQRLTFLDTTGAADGTGIIYEVNNLGRTASGLPGARMTYGYRTGGDLFTIENEANDVVLSVGRTTKVVTAVGGMQIGGGAVTFYRNAASGSATIPSLQSLAAADLTTIGLAGSKIGDTVNVQIVSPEIGWVGYRLTGVVIADGSVRVRVQNLTAGAASGGTVTFTVVAERFQ